MNTMMMMVSLVVAEGIEYEQYKELVFLECLYVMHTVCWSSRCYKDIDLGHAGDQRLATVTLAQAATLLSHQLL